MLRPRNARRGAAALCAVAGLAAVAGCGSARKLSLRGVRAPLPAGARVIFRIGACPAPPKPPCRRDELVSSARAPSSRALVAAQRSRLRAGGWRFIGPIAPGQVSAESPDGQTFASFATAADDLAQVRRGALIDPPRLRARLEAAASRRDALMVVHLQPLP